MSGRPVWRRDVSDPDCRVTDVDGFHVEVYRMTFGHWWGWHAWSADGSISVYSFLRRGSRWFRVLAVRDALREIATLRGGAR